MGFVFLAYSRQDSKLAGQVSSALSRDGINVWSHEEVAPGANWAKEIRAALAECFAVVAIWTVNSVRSAWALEEAEFAKEHKKLVPLLMDEVELPRGFRDVVTVDLREWSGRRDDKNWQQLIRSLNILIDPPRQDKNENDVAGSKKHVPADTNYEKLKGARGQKIFISHTSSDKEKVSPICKQLMDSGFDLWIDKPHELVLPSEYIKKIGDSRIRHSKDWKEQIREGVRKSNHVLVLWSRAALTGERENFHYEVYQGLLQQKLRQARLEDVNQVLGYPYRFDQIADLSAFKGQFNWELHYLMRELAVQDRRRWKWW